ncbi:hypothetical protein PUN28_013244 [Cardiocondyla obscurior]|uniref:Uncharacterized protein n=1 Tax=Cardiocondyla obscurior TaxID=286306 RepID=A0AAW2F7L4_9HYME
MHRHSAVSSGDRHCRQDARSAPRPSSSSRPRFSSRFEQMIFEEDSARLVSFSDSREFFRHADNPEYYHGRKEGRKDG